MYEWVAVAVSSTSNYLQRKSDGAVFPPALNLHTQCRVRYPPTMGTPERRRSLCRNNCSRHADWAAGDMVSLKLLVLGELPQDRESV